ncbi:probable E3 ubiquitin-protein ligase makorin-2 [Caerostris extrusa]|uniref:RING-type E3 ubiquitin transferase n=1 Tax=Caerostris extrusa TaxID=172846 RepID=A0AAV4P0A9_CAEEX|nr:probable E3 ubiquitin-protein ligase makorin-2 [Caerostris extrusa]
MGHHREREGSCRFGEKCWYTHSEPQPSIPKCEYQHPSMVCFNFAFNECDLGDACPAPHGDVCDWCELPLLHPSDEQQREEHLRECEATFLTDMDEAISYTNTVDSQCAICHDKVQEKGQIAKLTFGMQENCQHVFCLGCIREWKKKNSGCPICRVISHFVVPIDYGYIASSEQQKRLLEAHKANCNQIPCKFFSRGRCRFGEGCLYHHDADHSQQIDPLDPNSSTSYHTFGEQGECSAGRG